MPSAPSLSFSAQRSSFLLLLSTGPDTLGLATLPEPGATTLPAASSPAWASHLQEGKTKAKSRTKSIHIFLPALHVVQDKLSLDLLQLKLDYNPVWKTNMPSFAQFLVVFHVFFSIVP